jgi:hypothetical protein
MINNYKFSCDISAGKKEKAGKTEIEKGEIHG